MGSLPGILLLIVGLLVSVGLHEVGHLVPAKKFGAKVPQYFIGFGPTIWSTTKNGTEYGLKAIPLGGYVRIAGMVWPGNARRTQVNRKGEVTIAEEVRRASGEELTPEEEPHAFWRLSAAKRLVIMFGGPVMNLFIAGVLLAIVMSGIGALVPSNQISTVSTCIADTDTCEKDDPQAPGAQAGILPGDVVLSWGGTPTNSWTDVQQAIASSGTEPATVIVERESEQVTLTVTPAVTERPVVDENGAIVTDDSGETLTEQKPYVGIGPGYEHERIPITQIPAQLWDLTAGTANVIVKLPADLWDTAAGLFTGADRSESGVMGIVGAADLAGSITSTEHDAYGLSARIGDLLLLIASLNISLFLFNLLPLLPLDGGHIVGAAYEGARRKIAQLAGKPDPGPVDIARLMPLGYVVASLFIVMTVLLIIADIVNPVF
ncbi:MAG: M50 family metallopeptidase [Ancrocorticia sp.]|uniref:M50 family metallopeptidase n=1 Tax=Ancrocorticia sp. TaxID=2593684 RepID=UPI003F90A5B4